MYLRGLTNVRRSDQVEGELLANSHFFHLHTYLYSAADHLAQFIRIWSERWRRWRRRRRRRADRPAESERRDPTMKLNYTRGQIHSGPTARLASNFQYTLHINSLNIWHRSDTHLFMRAENPNRKVPSISC